jgi:hypothetical protein
VIVHIVLGKVADGLTDDESKELTDAFRRLGEVPGVQDFSCGPNISERSRGYTHAATMRFQDAGTAQAYQTHPLHLEIVRVLNRLAPERLVVDYEIGTSGISA